MVKSLVGVIGALYLIFTVTISGSAQSDNAQLSGFVKDANGAVVPGVKVVIKNQDKAFERTGVTTQEGYYVISSLPPGFAGSNFCSEILVSGDGRFVYAGNRLHDSIGIFSVGKSGELAFVGEEWTRGNYPRSFNFAPTGQFLYVCNQRADNVAVFRVNRKTGGLAFTGHYTPVGNPSAILFLDLAKEG